MGISQPMAQAVVIKEVTDAEQVFRPTKRRKRYRRRNDDDDEHTPSGPELGLPQASELPQPGNINGYAPDLLDHEGSPVVLGDGSLAELLRQRRLLQRRKGGVEFTNKGKPSAQQISSAGRSGRPTEQDEVAREIEKVVNRFAPQTGQIADVDKHMYDDQFVFPLARHSD